MFRGYVLRLFQSQSVVRLPALPRRLTFLIWLGLLVVGLAASPFWLNEMVGTRLNQAVEQAHLLSQVSEMHRLEGRRPEKATQALPLVGFSITTAEAAMPMQTWLLRAPSARQPVRHINIDEVTAWKMLSIVWWIMTCPPEAVFGVSNHKLTDGAAVTALTTTGLFQMNVNDALQRIILSVGLGALLLGLITHFAARRLMLGGLDDMFMRLYGSTVMGTPLDAKKSDLRHSLDRLQDRLRTHIDEQARLASLGAGASFLAHDMRNLLASLHLNAEQLVQMPGEKNNALASVCPMP